MHSALEKSNTVTRFCQRATHVVQAANLSITNMVNNELGFQREQKKTDLFLSTSWKNGENGSGKLLNSGKRFL